MILLSSYLKSIWLVNNGVIAFQQHSIYETSFLFILAFLTYFEYFRKVEANLTLYHSFEFSA